MSQALRRFLELVPITMPIIQAPMAGFQDADLCIAVSEAGGLGSLPCALLSPDKMRDELRRIRAKTERPFNLNFFCHTMPERDRAREESWKQTLKTHFDKWSVDAHADVLAATRLPFGDEACAVVEEFSPAVVSFHFGLPEARLLRRVKATGARVLSSATTVDEAKWLEEHGCDAIIAQGLEAGGHRGMFLTEDLSSQMGLFSLLPQITDAVSLPVIAAGGIADARGILAAFSLGAAAVQIGTAYLFTDEARISPLHRQALREKRDTSLTNLFSGRPARGLMNALMRERNPIALSVPPFPWAGPAIAALKTAAEAQGCDDFSSLWAGQSLALGQEMPAADLTRALWTRATTPM